MTDEPIMGGAEGEGGLGDDVMPFDEALHGLCQEHGIAAVYVLDSPGRVDAGPTGAPDIGVVFARPGGRREDSGISPAVLRDFRKLFGAEGLAVGDLYLMGPSQQYRAITGRMLYAIGEHRRAGFQEQVVRDYQDFSFEMRLFDEERAEEIVGETGGD